jgi:hypothetical protein
MLKLIGLEDLNYNLIILELILYLLHAGKSSVPTFGKMELKRQSSKRISISLISKVYLKKKRGKLKIKQIELLIHAVKLVRALWIKLRLRKYMDLVCIKEEWYQEIR